MPKVCTNDAVRLGGLRWFAPKPALENRVTKYRPSPRNSGSSAETGFLVMGSSVVAVRVPQLPVCALKIDFAYMNPHL
jgi:hypothetical protein